MNKNINPLVSVSIVTYNSACFILETLESINNQTYKNIELIISDDCSIDNTVEVCKNWIEKYKSRFIRCLLIESDYNTGVTGNINRALSKANGDWIKGIGGDDLLLPNAIEEYVKYVISNPECKHVMAPMLTFHDGENPCVNNKMRVCSKFYFRNSITSKKQHRILSKIFFGTGPTYFVSRDLLEKVGGYDERFPMQEDYALFIKLTGLGYKIYYMNIPTVLYRVRTDSLQHAQDSNAIYPKRIVRYVCEYQYEYKKEALNSVWRLLLSYSIWLHNLVINSGNTKLSIKCRIFYSLQILLDPFEWYRKYNQVRIRLYDRCHTNKEKINKYR